MTTMEVYDPLKDMWTSVAGQLGEGTMSNHLVMLNGKLVSYGPSVFSYDSEYKNWTKIEEANKGANDYFALVVVPCSKGQLYGSEGPKDEINGIYVYNVIQI